MYNYDFVIFNILLKLYGKRILLKKVNKFF